MRIKKILRQHRRDFTALYECEHCGALKEDSGYDDEYFHMNIVPTMKCPECGKIADRDYRPLSTKYPEGQQV